MHSYALSARERGIQVIIACAGGAAHSPGMVATSTFPLPVIGVPLLASTLDGVDSVLSILQFRHHSSIVGYKTFICQDGSLVATVAINNAANAGLLEVQMLAVYDADLFARISQYQEDTKSEILAEDEKLQKVGCESYLNP
ncbi:hypothetical protein ACLB2K_067453 [Fragaria x ananassa]